MDKVDRIIEENSDVWKSRSNFFSFVKGLLRKGWSRHPVKIKLLKKHRKQIPNPNQKGHKATVWGAECSVCNKTHVLSNIEIDHVLEETASLIKIEDIQSCVEKLLIVLEEDLRVVCKPCHSIITLSQRNGITFKEAQFEQHVIAFKKLSADKQKETLLSLDKNVIMPSSAAKRIELYRQLIKESSNGN